jgi:tRNA pseudouridine55 synthase
VETTTGDALGEIVKQAAVPDLNPRLIRAVLEKFIGRIEQIPPMYSALKKDGVRLYELAYQGIEVERQPRLITINRIDLLRHDSDSLDVEIECSKGTYIRTLAEDIGRALGCGAHVSALRRIGAGPFRESEMTGMPELQQLAESGYPALDRKLISIDAALSNLPSVRLASTVSVYLCEGQAVIIPRAPTSGMLRLYAESGEFIGIGEVLEDGRVAPRRLVVHANRDNYSK